MDQPHNAGSAPPQSEEPVSGNEPAETSDKSQPVIRTTPERDELAASMQGYFGRRRRVQARVRDGVVEPQTDIGILFAAQTADAFGTTSPTFATRCMNQLVGVLKREDGTAEQALNAGLAVVSGVDPENETEAMLAVQMAGTHDAAMSMLARAAQSTNPRVMEACGNLAVKLLRTYTAQMETLSKLRRGGEQMVRVEHVHVYPGGQAIVGAVAAPGVGGLSKMDVKLMHSLDRQPSPFRMAPRCCARTRRGTECQSPAVRGKRRCRIHGGAARSGAPRGERNGRYVHGLRTAEMKELRARLRDARAVLAMFD
ncbi:HGGxSTG domain-containing protein [Methylobacterium sp. WSM2598]|uniref:HGGxSTG domain-containing protein n=1 Tax=Methylobacterium sp. WSM2598 TaxID=398261 RepID=UPI00039C4525|nr:HGGxSTG domain-containing protein [Methylobacterium sp. WSM2598]